MLTLQLTIPTSLVRSVIRDEALKPSTPSQVYHFAFANRHTGGAIKCCNLFLYQVSDYFFYELCIPGVLSRVEDAGPLLSPRMMTTDYWYTDNGQIGLPILYHNSDRKSCHTTRELWVSLRFSRSRLRLMSQSRGAFFSQLKDYS